jgi:hypothetical protein
MANKIFNVTVTLPDLAAAHAEQDAKVESATWTAAIRLACEEISRRPHVRGKHIKSAKITFSVLDTVRAPGASRRDDPNGEAGSQGLLFEI